MRIRHSHPVHSASSILGKSSCTFQESRYLERAMLTTDSARSLMYTLHRSSLCSYFDPRDLIYANLSTSSAMKALEIQPDYTITAADVFKDMTCKYIERFMNLELLRSCDLQNLPKGFKSFVPDFTVPKSESRLLSVYAHAGSRQFLEGIGGEYIELKGRIVAKIKDVSKFRKPLPTSTLKGDNYMEIINTYRQWEPEGLMTSMSYPSGGTLLDAFIMLLSNGFSKETYSFSHLPTAQESKESFLAAVWSGGDADLIRDAKFKPYIGELMSDRRNEIFFETAEGYIGVSPSIVQTGDLVSVLVGASVPIILRPMVDQVNTYQVVGPCMLQGVMFGEGLLGHFPKDWSCFMHEKRRWCFQKQGREKRSWEDPRLWPLPPYWQTHSCDFENEEGPCGGGCEMEHEKADRLVDRWFYNTQSKEKSLDDPRLDAKGLEAGGIALQSLRIM